MSKPLGPYTPVVRAGEWIIVSGQLGIQDGVLVDGLSGPDAPGRREPEGASWPQPVQPWPT